MAFVQISKDFWVNVHTHEDLIKRCFHSIFKRFPLSDGRKGAYSFLLIALNKSGRQYADHTTVDVFHKFNEAEAVGYNYDALVKRGLTCKQIEDRVAHRVAKRGINVTKRFEQYMYKWIEKIMYTQWLKEREHRHRTVREASYDVSPQGTAFLVRRRTEGYNSWQDAKVGVRGHYGSTWMEKVDEKLEARNIKAPTLQDRGQFVSEHSVGGEDPTEAYSLQKRIIALLKTDTERKIVQMRLEDLSGKDIAATLGITTQYVSLLLQKIRERCVERGLITV